MDRLINKQTYTNRQIIKKIDGQTINRDRKTDRQTHRQTDKDRHTDRQTNTQTHTQRDRQTHNHSSSKAVRLTGQYISSCERSCDQLNPAPLFRPFSQDKKYVHGTHFGDFMIWTEKPKNLKDVRSFIKIQNSGEVLLVSPKIFHI